MSRHKKQTVQIETRDDAERLGLELLNLSADHTLRAIRLSKRQKGDPEALRVLDLAEKLNKAASALLGLEHDPLRQPTP